MNHRGTENTEAAEEYEEKIWKSILFPSAASVFSVPLWFSPVSLSS
jgi:hypothetical protein